MWYYTPLPSRTFEKYSRAIPLTPYPCVLLFHTRTHTHTHTTHTHTHTGECTFLDLHSLRTEFLNLSTISILGGIVPCGEGCAVHCKMFGSTPGLCHTRYQWYRPSGTSKNPSGHCKWPLGSKIVPCSIANHSFLRPKRAISFLAFREAKRY